MCTLLEVTESSLRSNFQQKMNSFKKNWFTETGPLWPGQAMSLEIEEILFEGKEGIR